MGHKAMTFEKGAKARHPHRIRGWGRRGGSWRGLPERLNNGVLSSMQKQTQKRLKSGFKINS